MTQTDPGASNKDSKLSTRVSRPAEPLQLAAYSSNTKSIQNLDATWLDFYYAIQKVINICALHTGSQIGGYQIYGTVSPFSP